LRVKSGAKIRIDFRFRISVFPLYRSLSYAEGVP